MNENDRGEGKRREPAQQMQQPQPVIEGRVRLMAARSTSENTREYFMEDAVKSKEEKPMPALDDARSTAGVVRLYEAVLKEPIPEEMLRLIREIGIQESK
jgi:hypothetical protein